MEIFSSKYVAILLIKLPIRTRTTQQLPYSVITTQTSVTRLVIEGDHLKLDGAFTCLPIVPVAFSAITM